MSITLPSRPLCAAPGQRPAKYTPAASTDLRATFEKYRRLQQMQQTAKERAQ